MFDVAESLRAGIDRSQQQLLDAQRQLAQANAGKGGRSADAAMAQTAQAAVFDEALLAAVRERLSELKMVTK
jgi:hypothetical protein